MQEVEGRLRRFPRGDLHTEGDCLHTESDEGGSSEEKGHLRRTRRHFVALGHAVLELFTRILTALMQLQTAINTFRASRSNT